MQLPEAFIQQIQASLGGESEFFFESLGKDPITSIRYNPAKPVTIKYPGIPVPWCREGLLLAERPSFIFDPLFHAGAYYVQESSSMFLHQVFTALLPLFQRPVKVLDLCAAPGGKSTLIASLIGEKSLLVANEIIKTRVNTLAENISRWGLPNVFVSNNDPRDFGNLKACFDMIVVDAPCSGEGMFRKDKKAAEEWSEANTVLCAGRQKRIIADIMPALKPGGFMVYSTCTFNAMENEENVKWMMDTFGLEPVEISTSLFPEVERTAFNGMRFWPHRVQGEGLFMACLQKPGNTRHAEEIKTRKKTDTLSAKEKGLYNNWIKDPQNVEIYPHVSGNIAIPQCHKISYELLSEVLKLQLAGIRLGEIKQTDIIPDHALALSVQAHPEIARTALNHEQALIYLKKGNLPATLFHGKGWQLVTFGGLALGWVKVLPNRINNYLPVNMRILKDIEPA